jgi:hypothetical protein
MCNLVLLTAPMILYENFKFFPSNQGTVKGSYLLISEPQYLSVDMRPLLNSQYINYNIYDSIVLETWKSVFDMSSNNAIMSAITLLPSFLSVSLYVVIACLLYFLYNREATSLRRIPGPFLASISQFWIVYQQRGLQRPIVDLELHRKYGTIVRIAPNEVMVSSPQSKKIIYGKSAQRRAQEQG